MDTIIYVIRLSILYICLSIIFLKCIKLRIFPEQPRSYNISLGEVLIKLIHSSIIVFWCITETTITKIFSKSSFYVDYNVFCQGFYKKWNDKQKWCWSPYFPCVATELLFQPGFKLLLHRKLLQYMFTTFAAFAISLIRNSTFVYQTSQFAIFLLH